MVIRVPSSSVVGEEDARESSDLPANCGVSDLSKVEANLETTWSWGSWSHTREKRATRERHTATKRLAGLRWEVISPLLPLPHPPLLSREAGTVKLQLQQHFLPKVKSLLGSNNPRLLEYVNSFPSAWLELG